MTVGSWQPDSRSNNIPSDALQQALTIDLDNFPTQTPERVKALQPFMKASPDQWQPVLEPIADADLKQLCRFFTLAEATWTDWLAGDKNPAIWICKRLKTRGAFPDKDLTQWIKQHSDNRFLPYGNALG